MTDKVEHPRECDVIVLWGDDVDIHRLSPRYG